MTTPTQGLAETAHAELLLLYSVTIEDIEKTKKWGWTVAYSTIAAQGAVLGLCGVYTSALPKAWEKALFALMVAGFGLVGLVHIRHAQASLRAFRERIKAIRAYFSAEFQGAFGEPTPKVEWPLEFLVVISTYLIVILVVLSGGA